jgi:hypothetical protein
MTRALCFAVGLVLAAGCEGKGLATVGKALLAQADGVIEPDVGPTLEVGTAEVTALPAAKVFRLAIDGDVPWQRVAQLIEWAEAEGKRPVLLVGRRHRVKALQLDDELQGPAIDLLTYTDGKACVRPPDTDEAGCVQTLEKKHIDRAYVRELVREARKAYGLEDVLVEIPPELTWANVVRAVDGARTCCSDGPMRVRIKRPDQQPAQEN